MKINIKLLSLIFAAAFVVSCSEVGSPDATLVVKSARVSSNLKYNYMLSDKDGYSFRLSTDEKFNVGDKLKLVKVVEDKK